MITKERSKAPITISRRHFLEAAGAVVVTTILGRILTNESDIFRPDYESDNPLLVLKAWNNGITQIKGGLYADWHAPNSEFTTQVQQYKEHLPLHAVGFFITFEQLLIPSAIETLRAQILWAHRNGCTPIVSIGNGQNTLEQPNVFHPDNRDPRKGNLILAQAQRLADFLAEFDATIIVRLWFEMNIQSPYGYKAFGKGYGLTNAQHVQGFQECWKITHDVLEAYCPHVLLGFSPSFMDDYPFEEYIPRAADGKLLCHIAGGDIYDLNPWPFEFLNPYYLKGRRTVDQLIQQPLERLKKLTDGTIPVGLFEWGSYTHDPAAEKRALLLVASCGGEFLYHFGIPKTRDSHYLGVIETDWRLNTEQLTALEEAQNMLTQNSM